MSRYLFGRWGKVRTLTAVISGRVDVPPVSFFPSFAVTSKWIWSGLIRIRRTQSVDNTFSNGSYRAVSPTGRGTFGDEDGGDSAISTTRLTLPPFPLPVTIVPSSRRRSRTRQYFSGSQPNWR